MYDIFGDAAYRNTTIIYFVSSILLVYAFFFVMPLVFLGGVNARNFCNNKTTSERLHAKKQKNLNENDSQRSSSIYTTTSSM